MLFFPAPLSNKPVLPVAKLTLFMSLSVLKSNGECSFLVTGLALSAQKRFGLQAWLGARGDMPVTTDSTWWSQYGIYRGGRLLVISDSRKLLSHLLFLADKQTTLSHGRRIVRNVITFKQSDQGLLCNLPTERPGQILSWHALTSVARWL